MKLFVFYVGGRTENSNTELHDVRFAVGESIEDCYPELRKQWWGTPGSLHLDCWGALEQADGYDITLSPEPYEGTESLWFLNLGAYDPTQFTELHHNMFVVAETESKAKVKALKEINHWQSRHKDNQVEIEQAIRLDGNLAGSALHVHLCKAETVRPFAFDYGYKPIALEKIQR